MDSKQNILLQFGDKVRAFRKEKGYSQEELAYRSGLHRTYIEMIERAEKNFNSHTLEIFKHI